mgnify:FL=1
MAIPHIIILSLVLAPLMGTAFGQTIITVNETQPCFLNNTASYHMLQNCDAKGDWLKWALLPFEWITGGYFTLILVSIFVLFTYLKYHKVIYPILIGILFVPVAYALFPETWINFALILLAVGVMIGLFKMLYKQTKEYS